MQIDPFCLVRFRSEFVLERLRQMEMPGGGYGGPQRPDLKGTNVFYAASGGGPYPGPLRHPDATGMRPASSYAFDPSFRPLPLPNPFLLPGRGNEPPPNWIHPQSIQPINQAWPDTLFQHSLPPTPVRHQFAFAQPVHQLPRALPPLYGLHAGPSHTQHPSGYSSPYPQQYPRIPPSDPSIHPRSRTSLPPHPQPLAYPPLPPPPIPISYVSALPLPPPQPPILPPNGLEVTPAPELQHQDDAPSTRETTADAEDQVDYASPARQLRTRSSEKLPSPPIPPLRNKEALVIAAPAARRSPPPVSPRSNNLPTPIGSTGWLPDIEKTVVCPHQYCSKRFKQANGLKYHLAKGTCDSVLKLVGKPALTRLEAIAQSRPVAQGDDVGEPLMKNASTATTVSSDSQLAALRFEYMRARPYACHSKSSCGKRYRNPGQSASSLDRADTDRESSQTGGLKYHYLHCGVSSASPSLSRRELTCRMQSHGVVGAKMMADGTHPAPSTTQ